MKRIALLLAATAFTAPAFAADVIYDEPMAPAPMAIAPVASGWTGLYLGVQGGAAFDPDGPDSIYARSTSGSPVLGGTPAVDQFDRNFDTFNDSSFIGGAHIGYDYQVGNFVVGALVDINAMEYKETSQVISRTADALYSEERSLDYLATGRLRAGYLITPMALAYVTGGVAYGETDYEFVTTNTGQIDSLTTNTDENDFGYTVGGGMEVKLRENLSFGAEYLYTNLGDSDSSATFTAAPFNTTDGGSTSFQTDGDFDFHTITAKVSYRFN